jgi:hypothetical protein
LVICDFQSPITNQESQMIKRLILALGKEVENSQVKGRKSFFSTFRLSTPGLLSLCLVLAASPAWASVAFNNTNTSAIASGNSFSSSFTVDAGSNLVAFAAVGWWDGTGQSVTSISLGGQTMTSCGAAVSVNDAGLIYYAQVFYLVNPPTGTQTLAITMTSGTYGVAANVITFTGVNPNTPVRSGTYTTSSGGPVTSASQTITSNTNDRTFGFIWASNGVTSTNQTSTGTSIGLGTDYATTPASSITDTWTISSGYYALVGFSIRVGFVTGMNESNTASDTISRQAAFARTDSETNTASDAIARLAKFGRVDSESNTASDAIARLASFGRGETESNTASDAIALSGVFGRSDSESNAASDAVARLASFGRGDSESNTASDAIARSGVFGRSDSESNPASDAVARLASFGRGETESNPSADGIARLASFGRGDSEVLTVSDRLSRVLAALRGDTEILAFGDSIVVLSGGKVMMLPRHAFSIPGQTKSGSVPGQVKTGEEPGRVKSGTAPPH